jgi:aryl-alcohol dehydrogenase-like predicted oxidoreductase
MMGETLQSIREFIDGTNILSTHEHHRDDDFHRTLDLDALFANSYVSWCSLPRGKSPLEREKWLDRVRLNSYYVWLEKAVQRIYGTDPIEASNWDDISERIRKAHADEGHHLRLLRRYGRYFRFLEDCYWNTGSDLGHPEIVTPVYRIDPWMNSHSPELVLSNISPDLAGAVNDLDGFEAALANELKKRRGRIAALKNAIAYHRTIRFRPVDREEASAIYGKSPDAITEPEKIKFGDYVMSRAAELAAGLDLPIQIHTGLALLSGSNPMNLEPFIARFPKTRFVLFHGGFPWIKEHAAIAHNHKNVVLDINWLPIISTTSAMEALHTYIETIPDSGHITWGGDCHTSYFCPDALRKHCEQSLKRLQTDYIDLYMLHWPINRRAVAHFTSDPERIERLPDMREGFETLRKLQQEGKIRYIGISNHGVEQMKEVMETGAEVVANELAYNLFSRAIEESILPYCVDNRIGVIAYMPLQQGLLSGKYRSVDEIRPMQARSRHFHHSRGEGTRHGEEGAEAEIEAAMREIRRIAADLGISVAALSLAWVIANPGITTAIVGSRNAEQLEANVQGAHFTLPPDIVTKLNAITEPVLRKLGSNPDYYENRCRSRIR